MSVLRPVLALAVVLGVAMPATAQVPPPLTPLLIMEDGSGGCFFLGEVKPKIGSGISFSNSDSQVHDVGQPQGFWSFSVPGDGSRFVAIHAAGTYTSTCDGAAAEVVAKTRVRAPTTPSSPGFTVTWADAVAAVGWTYDVQYRVGSGDWQAWKQGTSLRSASFVGATGKTYLFRSRVTRVGGTTGWSPAKKVTT